MRDLPALLARFTAACHAAGLPVGPDRAVRLTRAVVAVRPQTSARLRACAHATLVADPAELPLLDRVFDTVFGAGLEPAVDDAGRGDPSSSADHETLAAPRPAGAPTPARLPAAPCRPATVPRAARRPTPGGPACRCSARPPSGSRTAISRR